MKFWGATVSPAFSASYWRPGCDDGGWRRVRKPAQLYSDAQQALILNITLCCSLHHPESPFHSLCSIIVKWIKFIYYTSTTMSHFWFLSGFMIWYLSWFFKYYLHNCQLPLKVWKLLNVSWFSVHDSYRSDGSRTVCLLLGWILGTGGKGLAQGWANVLTHGPHWVLKSDRGAVSGADGWSVSVRREKKIYHSICRKFVL